jgi:hypothetical protein
MTPDSPHPADRIIDRTLQTLRDAEPRAGVDALNGRVVAGLQSRVAAQLDTASPLWQRLRQWRAAEFALPAAALLLVAITWLIPRTRPTPVATGQPSVGSNAILSAIPPTPRVSRILTRRCGPATACATATAAHRLDISASVTPSEQALLDDLHAPSQPARPLPLTRDEQMLLRAARRSSEVQVAQLETLPRPATHRHRDEDIAEYVHHMLAPLVAAESIDPTPATEPDTEPPPSLP